MSDLDRVAVGLLVFAVFCLACGVGVLNHGLQALHANANEACANLCSPYAPDLRAGACYCHTDKVMPEAIPGED